MQPKSLISAKAQASFTSFADFVTWPPPCSATHLNEGGEVTKSKKIETYLKVHCVMHLLLRKL